MARKGWNALSAGYKSRLQKAGISKQDYEKGHSIQAARGHAATPERPTQKSGSFPVYQAERDRLTRRVVDLKQAYFGTKPVFNPRKAVARFKKDPPSMEALRRWTKLTKEEWIDAIRTDPSAGAYLGYH